MKYLDKVIRNWRTQVSGRYVRERDSVLDIGCFDGYLFRKFEQKKLTNCIGVDPLLDEDIHTENYQLLKGNFPDALPADKKFDTITMLVVLEHIPRSQQNNLSEEFYGRLNDKGRVIITVPSPAVDKILDVLMTLKLIDGMSLDEHFGFHPNEVIDLFQEDQFTLLSREKFQFGLNNLFVFEKVS
ncbi:MAG: methyltransferase domain-containing protein [Bacteroidota bacterium]